MRYRGTRMFKMKRVFREGDQGDGSTAIEQLERTSIDWLEETVKALKKHWPAAEVRDALMKRVACAPLDEFKTLERILFTHSPN
jgi:hypothetical protein